MDAGADVDQMVGVLAAGELCGEAIRFLGVGAEVQGGGVLGLIRLLVLGRCRSLGLLRRFRLLGRLRLIRLVRLVGRVGFRRRRGLVDLLRVLGGSGVLGSLGGAAGGEQEQGGCSECGDLAWVRVPHRASCAVVQSVR